MYHAATTGYTTPSKFSAEAHVNPALHSCTHVFVPRDAICRSLQHPYDGPFKVLKRSDKYYTVSVKGQQQTISLDRLKPAHLDVLLPASDQLQSTSPTPPETHHLIHRYEQLVLDGMFIFRTISLYNVSFVSYSLKGEYCSIVTSYCMHSKHPVMILYCCCICWFVI